MGPAVPANVERFMGFAEDYDAYRPAPPRALVDVLRQLAQSERPRVVDIGCGTGLSSRIWAGLAESVIGVEPSDDMRRRAEAATAKLPGCQGIRYQSGASSETHLGDASADIVTISQALHWMPPEPTFREVARILRAGGVFAAVDCDWPPVMNAAAERAYDDFTAETRKLEKAHGDAQVQRWAKAEHLQRIRNSGLFGYTREILLHSIEQGNAQRLVGLAMSFGGVQTLLKAGVPQVRELLGRLAQQAQESLGETPRPWLFCYRVQVGIK